MAVAQGCISAHFNLTVHPSSISHHFQPCKVISPYYKTHSLLSWGIFQEEWCLCRVAASVVAAPLLLAEGLLAEDGMVMVSRFLGHLPRMILILTTFSYSQAQTPIQRAHRQKVNLDHLTICRISIRLPLELMVQRWTSIHFQIYHTVSSRCKYVLVIP